MANFYDHIAGIYGAFAFKISNTPIWMCGNSDYEWSGVTDDYGNIVAVSRFINIRGY